MSTQTVIGRSPQLVALETPKPPNAPSNPQNRTFELIDSGELANRLSVSASWIRSHTRRRTDDEIPCVRFGRYVRFRWGSPELERWITEHEVGRG